MKVMQHKKYLSLLAAGLLIAATACFVGPFKSVSAAPSLNNQLKAACQDYEKAYKKAGSIKDIKLSKKEKNPHGWCKNFKPIDPSASGQQLLKKDLKDTKDATGSINTKISKAGDGGKKGGDKDKDKGGPTGPFSLSAGDLGLDSSDPDASFKSILNGVYAVAGGVAVLIIVISGLLMVVNGDNAQNVADARNSVIYAAVGLAVVILAFVITNVVMAIV